MKKKDYLQCLRHRFDGAASWSFGQGFVHNVITFGTDNSSSRELENSKNLF